MSMSRTAGGQCDVHVPGREVSLGRALGSAAAAQDGHQGQIQVPCGGVAEWLSGSRKATLW